MATSTSEATLEDKFVNARVPYRITPLNPDGTADEQRAAAAVTGEHLVQLSNEYQTQGPDDDPAKMPPARLNLTVDGQDAREWDLDDFRFECWPRFVTNHPRDGDETVYGFFKVPHVRKVTLADGTFLDVIPDSRHALFVLDTTGDTPDWT
jgi:hypothetical protein